ncbi:hypothetical protein [Eleftheria terrae]|uniref:hypothetical protein n=1 Tax=Eleftheria terrae TaxID=1597781 RepID=UPI00263B514E|nr:hypothetical protein [Eleftheria terrae]WKB52331.1 hypothetical protein N7L95_21445 [Eleftheria terrae]
MLIVSSLIAANAFAVQPQCGKIFAIRHGSIHADGGSVELEVSCAGAIRKIRSHLSVDGYLKGISIDGSRARPSSRQAILLIKGLDGLLKTSFPGRSISDIREAQFRTPRVAEANVPILAAISLVEQVCLQSGAPATITEMCSGYVTPPSPALDSQF